MRRTDDVCLWPWPWNWCAM